MANGSVSPVYADWFFKAALAIGTLGMGGLTKTVWDMGNEQAAARERDKYVIQELQKHGAMLDQMRGDLNQLLSRKP